MGRGGERKEELCSRKKWSSDIIDNKLELANKRGENEPGDTCTVFRTCCWQYITPVFFLFQLRAWLLSIGFTLSYGAMFSKIWTVHRLTTMHKKERKVKTYHVRSFLVITGVCTVLTLCYPANLPRMMCSAMCVPA